MKKALQFIGISIFLLLLFRGFVYRLLVKYQEIGTRTEIEITNDKLITIIEDEAVDRKIELEEIADISAKLTNDILSFTTYQTSNNPNELMHSKQANCVGYSTMFNAIANYLIQKNRLQEEFAASHKIGQLNLLGMNIHPYFDSSFFKDHDFNELRNLKTGKVIAIDPSLNDYFWINRVTKVKNDID